MHACAHAARPTPTPRSGQPSPGCTRSPLQEARRAVARFVDETGPFCKLLSWLRRAARGNPAPLAPVPPNDDGRGRLEWVFCGEAARALVSDVVGLRSRAAVDGLVRKLRVMRSKLIEEGLESHAVRRSH